MAWNCELELGSLLRIKLSAYIDAKDTPLDTWSVDTADGAVTTKTSFYLNDKELSAERRNDLIKAFVYGKTPVAYDRSLGIGGDDAEKCLVCIGFTDEHRITDACLAGTGIWSVVPQVGFDVSEKMFTALVAAMRQKKRALIVRYVYRKGTQPRVMALFTRQSTTVPYKNDVSLSMMELLYAGTDRMNSNL